MEVSLARGTVPTFTRMQPNFVQHVTFTFLANDYLWPFSVRLNIETISQRSAGPTYFKSEEA